LACLIVGIAPAVTIGPFLNMAVHSVLGEQTPAYSLAVWHGFTAPLILSLVALAAGGASYLIFRQRLNAASGPPLIGYLKGRRGFELGLYALISGARWLMRYVGAHRLQPQFRVLVTIAVLAA